MLRGFYQLKIRFASRLRYLRNHWFWQFFVGVEQTRELNCMLVIKKGLAAALPTPVSMVIAEPAWSVRFETSEAVIAVVTARRREGKPFFFVDIGDGFEQYKAYFQAGLIGYPVRYDRAPKLLTRKSQA